MMANSYPNAPLVEAICEFRLSPDTLWDLTVPGLVYEKIRNDFPKKDSRLVQDIEISHGPQGIQQQIRNSERMIFFSQEKKLLVQMGHLLLAINALRPYPGWTNFKPKIEKVWNSLREIVDVKGFERVGLRYVNRIDLPSPDVKMEEYFAFYPHLGSRLPQRKLSFIVGSEFSYSNGRDRCRLVLFNDPSGMPERLTVLLDIDYFLAQPSAIEASSVLAWVEGAHQRVEEIFEGCLEDRLRELFR
jgi:uncharacterized protein (TIGR04255 family)